MQSTKRLKKVEVTANIDSKVAKAKSIIVTDYRGLTTSQLAEVRNKLAAVKAEYQITKNTLLARALRSRGFTVDMEKLSGPTAVVFSYEEEVAPIKAILDYAKATQLPKLKVGYVDKIAYDDKQLDSLSKLPGKDALRGQVVGTLQMPITSMVNVLQGNIRNLVYVLNAIKDQK